MAAELITEWVVDYACHKRMTSAIHVFSFEEMKEIAMQELIGGPSNVSVRFMLATIETIMKQDDAKEYITALRLINDLYDATGKRIPFRFYAKSITGLKILVLFEMLKEGDKDVLMRLDEYFPPEGYSHPLGPARMLQTMTSAQLHFRDFFIPMVNDKARREEYFSNGMSEDFGPNFYTKLKKRIEDVTTKVEALLPDTMITKLLGQPDIISKLLQDPSPLIKEFASILAEKESVTEKDIISMALAIKSYNKKYRKNSTSSHHAVDNLMETTNIDDQTVENIADSTEQGSKYSSRIILPSSEDENANMVLLDTKSNAGELCAREEDNNSSRHASVDTLDTSVNVGEKRLNTVDKVSNSIEGSHSADKDGASEYMHVCAADNSDKTQTNQARTVEGKSCTNEELRQENDAVDDITYTQLKDDSSLLEKKAYDRDTEEEDDGSDDNFGLDDISESFELQVYASGKKHSEKHSLITNVNNQIERTISSDYNVKTDSETEKSTVKRKGTVSTNESPAKVSKDTATPHRHLDNTLDSETVNKGSHIESSNHTHNEMKKSSLINDLNTLIARTITSGYSMKTSTVKRKETATTNELPVSKVSKYLGVPHKHLNPKENHDLKIAAVNKSSRLESSSSVREMVPPVITKLSAVNTLTNSHVGTNDSASSYSLNPAVNTHIVSSKNEQEFHTPSASPGRETTVSPTVYGPQQVEADSWESGSENQSSLIVPSSFSIDEANYVPRAPKKSIRKSQPTCQHLSGMHCLVPVYQFTDFEYEDEIYDIYK